MCTASFRLLLVAACMHWYPSLNYIIHVICESHNTCHIHLFLSRRHFPISPHVCMHARVHTHTFTHTLSFCIHINILHVHTHFLLAYIHASHEKEQFWWTLFTQKTHSTIFRIFSYLLLSYDSFLLRHVAEKQTHICHSSVSQLIDVAFITS